MVTWLTIQTASSCIVHRAIRKAKSFIYRRPNRCSDFKFSVTKCNNRRKETLDDRRSNSAGEISCRFLFPRNSSHGNEIFEALPKIVSPLLRYHKQLHAILLFLRRCHRQKSDVFRVRKYRRKTKWRIHGTINFIYLQYKFFIIYLLDFAFEPLQCSWTFAAYIWEILILHHRVNDSIHVWFFVLFFSMLLSILQLDSLFYRFFFFFRLSRARVRADESSTSRV